MTTPERRHLPRTTLDRLAYINIERDNGGIVLNVSDGGLCFQSVAPVERNDTIHFSLFEHGRLIDARGELVWTHETKQFGGLRFTTLTSEARGQINEWVTQPLIPLDDNKASTPMLPVLVGENTGSTAMFPLRPRVHMNLGGFSAGLAIGLFISAVVASIFQFSGYPFTGAEQQLAAHLEVQRQTALRAPQVVTPTVGRLALSPARPQPSRRVASRQPANKHGSAAIVLEPAVVVTDPSPAERVLIAAAPQSFGYPVAPDPALTGKVSLKLLIGRGGSVKDVSVRSGNRALADATVRAVRHWRYRPPELNGHAVEAEANITITFVGDDAVTINFRQ